MSTCLTTAIFSTTPVHAQGNKAGMDNSDQLITVLNPAATSKYAERVPLSPRLDSLDGKTIYMIDINWGGPDAAYSVFEEMAAWFQTNMPSVKTVIKRKRGSYMVPDDSTWKEVKDNGGDAAIVGISG